MRDPAVSVRHTLSPVELDVVWEALGLGPTPVVLQLPSPGRTHTERRRLVAATWAGLRDRELAGLTHLLHLLAAPVGRLELRGHGIRAVAAARDDEGVLARRDGDTVVLAQCVSLPAAVVGLLPPAPPGPGRAASAPTAVLTAALDRPSGAGLRADLVDRGVPPEEAGVLARMLHGGVVEHAQFGVVTADRWGTLRRSPEVLDLLDGPQGRYLVTRRDGWTTVAPTDARRVRHRVTELLAQSRSPCRISCRPDSVIEPDSDG